LALGLLDFMQPFSGEMSTVTFKEENLNSWDVLQPALLSQYQLRTMVSRFLRQQTVMAPSCNKDRTGKKARRFKWSGVLVIQPSALFFSGAAFSGTVPQLSQWWNDDWRGDCGQARGSFTER